MNPLAIFAALLIGHALADCPLQGSALSQGKRRTSGDMWLWSLSGHASIHAGAVWLITGNGWLALAEYVAHALIDFAKCEGRIGVKVDQGLHVACKILWVIILWRIAHA